QLANWIERFEIRDRIRTRCPADRRLIDERDIGDVLEARKIAVCANAPIPIALRAFDRRVQHVMHQRGLARSAYAGDARDGVQRDVDIDAFEIVFGCTFQLDLLPSPSSPW